MTNNRRIALTNTPCLKCNCVLCVRNEKYILLCFVWLELYINLTLGLLQIECLNGGDLWEATEGTKDVPESAACSLRYVSWKTRHLTHAFKVDVFYESTTARLLLLVVILTGLQAHQLPRLFAPTRQSESRSNRGIIKVKMERPTVGCASQGTALLILQP